MHRKAYVLSQPTNQKLNQCELYTNGTHQPHCTRTLVSHYDCCSFIANKCYQLSRYTSHLLTTANTFYKQNYANIQMLTKCDLHYGLPRSDIIHFTRSVPAHQWKSDTSTSRKFTYCQVEGNRFPQNTSLYLPTYVESLFPRPKPWHSLHSEPEISDIKPPFPPHKM